MKRWLLAVALVSVAIATGVAMAGGKGGDDGIEEKVRLAFLDVSRDQSFVPADPDADPNAPPAPGDTYFFANTLRNLADTKRVGRFDGRCIFLIGGLAECRGHVKLRHGSIELGGGINFADEPAVLNPAVLGGTGLYKNVTGEATIREVGEGRSRLVIELIPAGDVDDDD